MCLRLYLRWLVGTTNDEKVQISAFSHQTSLLLTVTNNAERYALPFIRLFSSNPCLPPESMSINQTYYTPDVTHNLAMDVYNAAILPFGDRIQNGDALCIT